MNETHLVVIAYACEPERGSEPEAGWLWARMLARFSRVTVVTRANNRDVIERALVTLPEADRMAFEYVDLPAWARTWKRNNRGVHLYYLLWLAAAASRVRRLRERRHFTAAWHVTLANAWFGTSLSFLPRLPFVFGPVGGATRTPWRLLPTLGWRGAAREVLRTLIRGTARYLNPITRITWRRASLILAQNEETLRWFPASQRHKIHVCPNVAVVSAEAARPKEHDTPVAALIGRLDPLKGAPLAIQAIEHLPAWRLLILGAGRQEPRLRDYIRKRGLSGRVEFRGWVARDEVARCLRDEVDVLLFPSLQEEGGFAVAEAVAAGVPVVALDMGGPPLLGAQVVAAKGVPRASLVRALAAAAESAQSMPAPGPRTLERVETEIRELIAASDIGAKTQLTPAIALPDGL